MDNKGAKKDTDDENEPKRCKIYAQSLAEMFGDDNKGSKKDRDDENETKRCKIYAHSSAEMFGDDNSELESHEEKGSSSTQASGSEMPRPLNPLYYQITPPELLLPSRFYDISGPDLFPQPTAQPTESGVEAAKELTHKNEADRQLDDHNAVNLVCKGCDDLVLEIKGKRVEGSSTNSIEEKEVSKDLGDGVVTEESKEPKDASIEEEVAQVLANKDCDRLLEDVIVSEAAAMEPARKLEADKQLTERNDDEIAYGLAVNSATKVFDDLLREVKGNRVKGSSSDPTEKEKEISKDLGDCVAQEESKETKDDSIEEEIAKGVADSLLNKECDDLVKDLIESAAATMDLTRKLEVDERLTERNLDTVTGLADNLMSKDCDDVVREINDVEGSSNNSTEKEKDISKDLGDGVVKEECEDTEE